MGDPAESLAGFLYQKRKNLSNRWFESIAHSYPPDSSKFLRREKDRFANPVGLSISEGVEAIIDSLLEGRPATETVDPLDKILRIRAVQDFTPAQAVAFVFSLKGIVREMADREAGELDLAGDLAALERWIDELALVAFNVYMKCREEIFEIRVQEMHNRTSRIVDRLNRIYEKPGPDQDRTEA